MANRNTAPDVTLVLNTGPYCYGVDEQELADREETVNRELVFKEDIIKGSAPGLIRCTVDNDSGTDWRGVAMALESRDYSPEASAKLAYGCGELTAQGGAVNTGPSIWHQSLPNTWQSVMSSRIASGNLSMSHRGTRRIWMRIYDPGATPGEVQLRLEWRALGAGRWTPNRIVSTKLVGGYSIVDMGECHPQRAVLGEQQWEWRILARTVGTAGAQVYLERVWIFPAEQMAVVKEPPRFESPSNILLRDSFNQTAGPLDLKSMAQAQIFSGPRFPNPANCMSDASGGVRPWTSPGNVGTEDDFGAEATLGGGQGAQPTHYLKATNFGHTIPAGATIQGIKVEIRGYVYSNSGFGGFDNEVKLISSGSAVYGDNKKLSGQFWPGIAATRTYGGESDTWGVTLNNSEVSSPNFGVAFSLFLYDASAVAEFDSIKMTVYYTPSGGQTWFKSSGIGDFSINATTHKAERTAVSDAAGIENGQFERAGYTVLGNSAVQVVTQSSLTGALGDAERGVFLRYANLANFLGAYIQPSSGRVVLLKRVGGTTSVISNKAFDDMQSPGPFTITAFALVSGLAAVYVDGVLRGAALDTALQIGQFLPSGQVGIFDHKSSATPETRTYDEFAVWQPEVDAVAFAGRGIEFRSDGVYRQNVAMDAWARVVPDGFLPYAPPSGLEERSLRGIVLPSRGDFDQIADSGDDDISARVRYHPGYHFASEAS